MNDRTLGWIAAAVAAWWLWRELQPGGGLSSSASSTPQGSPAPAAGLSPSDPGVVTVDNPNPPTLYAPVPPANNTPPAPPPSSAPTPAPGPEPPPVSVGGGGGADVIVSGPNTDPSINALGLDTGLSVGA